MKNTRKTPQEIVQIKKLLFSITAACRITGREVKQTQLMPPNSFFNDMVGVYFKHGGAQLLHKDLFLTDFADNRKLNGQRIADQKKVHKITEYGFQVESQEKDGENYYVNLFTNSAQCSCHDWQKQKKLLPQQCCKHIYAVLFHLGYESLDDYGNAIRTKEYTRLIEEGLCRKVG